LRHPAVVLPLRSDRSTVEVDGPTVLARRRVVHPSVGIPGGQCGRPLASSAGHVLPGGRPSGFPAPARRGITRHSGWTRQLGHP